MAIMFKISKESRWLAWNGRWDDYLRSHLSSILLFPPISTAITDNTIYQWHLHLGHASSDKLHNLVSIGTLNNVSKFSPFECLNCKLIKQLALSFTTSASSCDIRFSVIHSDIWGPTSFTIVNGCRYFYLFVDDYSHFTWIYFLNIVFPYLKPTLILQIWFTLKSFAQLKFFAKIMQSNIRTPTFFPSLLNRAL